LTEGEIADFVRQLDLEAFDLILIDDSKNSTQRERTIRAVAHKQPQHPWIVIHDFEVQDYQRAGSAFRQRYRFKAYNPETGLMWNNGNGPNNVKSFDRVLKRGAKTLQPDNVESWRRLFL
jgi:hypothetical protein